VYSLKYIFSLKNSIISSLVTCSEGV
jgi:hypothetical protein